MEQGNSVFGRNEGPNRTCGIIRQTLADVSNTADTIDRTTKSCAGNFAELMKEYNKLRMILAKKDKIIESSNMEKNKIIESSNMEKQNLRNQLKVLKEQNMGLARSNSRHLASINTAKEMYTHLKHELKCNQLVSKQLKREIEEVRKLNKEIKETKAQVKTTVLPSTSKPFRAKNPSTCVMIAVIAEEDETKLEEEQQIIHNSPPRVEFSTALHGPRRSENQGEFNSVVRGSRQKLVNQGGECSSVVRGPHQGSANMTARRRSIDRPLRKAVEKVSSYKETPLNSKLRRPF